MTPNTYETILLDVFLTNQKRSQLIDAALAGTDVPAEDYPLYVIVGSEGPWTATGLADRLQMPLTTVLFRVKRLERRGDAERIANPDDGRSFLIRLTPKGRRHLKVARPRFRRAAEAVEALLGDKAVEDLRTRLARLRDAIDTELSASARPASRRAPAGARARP